MARPEPDPFASLITANCHVTPSQSALHRSAPFVRHRELFPRDSSSQYHIPVETTAIRMEEGEFLTPQEESTSPDPMVVKAEPERKIKSVRELIYSLKRKEDKVFDKMTMRKLEAKTARSVEASDLRETCDFYATKKGMGESIGTGVEQNRVINNNISSTQIIDLDEDEECADLPVRNNMEVKMGTNGHNVNIEIVDDLDDVEVPRRNGDVVDLPKVDDVCNKGKGATRVLPRWLFNKDGFLIRNDDPNKEMNKRDGVEKKKMLEIDESKSVASSLSGKTKEDERMKNLLDGLDLVIPTENKKVDKKVDILGAAMRRGLICTRPSWWPPEKKIPEPGVGKGSGRV